MHDCNENDALVAALRVSEEQKGASLSNETVAYFSELTRMLNEVNADIDDDERSLMIARAFDESVGCEYRLCVNRQGSAALEIMLQRCSMKQCRRFMQRIVPFAAALCVDRCASHVLEAALSRVNDTSDIDDTHKHDDDDDDECEPPQMSALISSICDDIAQHFITLIVHPAATHVIRRLARVLSGQHVAHNHHKHHPRKVVALRVSSSSQRAVLKSWANALIHANINATNDVLMQTCLTSQGSAAIQEIIHALSIVKLTDIVTRLGNTILFSSRDAPRSASHFTEELCKRFDRLVNDCSSSHIVEALINTSSSSTFLHWFVTLFQHRLLARCSSSSASNFVVQKLLSSAHDEAQAALILQELIPHIHELVSITSSTSTSNDKQSSHTAFNRAGVVLQLIQLSARFTCHCRELSRAVLRAFDVKDATQDTRIVEQLLGLGVSSPNISALGSRIAQALLTLSDVALPSFIITSTLALGPERIVQLAFDCAGSHLLQQVLKSTALSPSSRKRFLRALEASLCELAAHRFGSFIVETLFIVADVKQKQKIAQQLADAERELMGSRYGSVVLSKCRVRDFIQRREQWNGRARTAANVQKSFAKLINDDSTEINDSINENNEAQSKHANAIALPGQRKTKKTVKMMKTEDELERELIRRDHSFGAARSEIDALFRAETKKSRKKRDKMKLMKRNSTILEGEDVVVMKRKKEAQLVDTSHHHADLNDVFEAIVATKRKKKKTKHVKNSV